MNILSNLKEKVLGILPKTKTSIKDLIYMEDGSSVMCEDKQNDCTKSTRVVAKHINEDLDTPIEFPTFYVIKTTSRDGMFSTHVKVALVLDADDEPIEGSKNLLTSGTLFSILSDLQDQIDDLKFSLEK